MGWQAPRAVSAVRMGAREALQQAASSDSDTVVRGIAARALAALR